MNKLAFGVIDAQRGFMPATEGARLDKAGFGELPVEGGEQTVDNLNTLLAAVALYNGMAFTTQDWHPRETAHFAEQPNFTTTWPVHCVGGTPGAELHPEINLPPGTIQFRKGMEALTKGEDDNSYSGYNGKTEQGELLADVLRTRGITTVYLGGLALDYCVGRTALDIRDQLGIDVVVALDASRGIADASVQTMLQEFKQRGIRTATTDTILKEIATQNTGDNTNEQL